MPTASKTWQAFDAAEFSATPDVGDDANLVAAQIAGDGNPPPDLEFKQTVGNASVGGERARGSGAQTWESLFGIPAGSTIVSVQCTGYDVLRWADTNVTSKNFRTRIRLVNDTGVSATAAAGDLADNTEATSSTVGTPAAQAGGTSRAVDAAFQPSSSTVHLEVQLSLAGTAVNIDYEQDNIAITVTYTTGGAAAFRTPIRIPNRKVGPQALRNRFRRAVAWPPSQTVVTTPVSNSLGFEFESLQGISAPEAGGVESAGGVQTTATDPLESIQALAAATTAEPIESNQGLATTAADPVESTQGIASTGAEPYEAVQALAGQTLALPYESLQAVPATTATEPLEAAQGVATTASDPVEAAGGVSATGSDPYESIQALAGQSVVLPYEAAQGVTAATVTLALEALGGIAQLGTLALEALGGIARTAVDSVESLLGLATSTSDPVESVQAVATTSSDPVESAGGIAATGAEPYEALGGVASTSGDPIESQQAGVSPVSTTASFAIEALGGIQTTGADPLEAGQAVQTTAGDPLEAAQAVPAATTSDPLEAVQGVAGQTATEPLESNRGVSTTAGDPVEATGGVSATPVLPLEEIQPIAGSTTTTPYESVRGVGTQTALLPLEALGRIASSSTGGFPVEANGFTPIVADVLGAGGGGFPPSWVASLLDQIAEEGVECLDDDEVAALMLLGWL